MWFLSKKWKQSTCSPGTSCLRVAGQSADQGTSLRVAGQSADQLEVARPCMLITIRTACASVFQRGSWRAWSRGSQVLEAEKSPRSFTAVCREETAVSPGGPTPATKADTYDPLTSSSSAPCAVLNYVAVACLTAKEERARAMGGSSTDCLYAWLVPSVLNF